MKNKLGYLIVTHNGGETLPSLLSSISDKQDILIVDNASADDTLTIAAQYGVQVLKNENNLGYGAAINQGVALLAETYTHVFVLNQDCVIDKLEFPSLEGRDKGRGTEPVYDTTSPSPNLPPQGGGIFSEYAIVQPLILLPDGSVNVDKLVMNMLGYVYPINFGKVPVDALLHENERPTATPPSPRLSPEGRGFEDSRESLFFSGAAFMINLEKFTKVGPFDESLFLYYEDVDYAMRCRLAGEKVLFAPDIVVTHHYSSFRHRPDKRKMLSLNRKKIINRYFPARWKRWLWIRHNPLEIARTTAEQKETLSVVLKQEAVLGFCTKQFSFWQRLLLNLLVVPYSWLLKRII